MAKQSANAKNKSFGVFGNLSLYFVDRPRFTAALMVAVIGFGFLSYTTLIRREGFPPVDIPISLVQGIYFVDDAAAVDEQVAMPLQEAISAIPSVKKVSTTSSDNFVFLSATLDNATGGEVKEEVQAAIDNTTLPPQARLDILDFDAAKFFGQYDIVISLYSIKGATAQELEEQARTVTTAFSELDLVENSTVDTLFREGINPKTGKPIVEQVAFSQIGIRETPNSEITYYRSAVIGLNGHTGDELDIFKLGSAIVLR